MSPNRFARGNRDKNEKFHTEVLRRMNVEYGLLPEGFGADILAFLSPLVLIEVKDPSQPPSKRQLTPREKFIQSLCATLGIPYHIVLEPEDTAKIVGDWIREVDRLATG